MTHILATHVKRMYPALRNFELKSIGFWQYGVGRPTTESTKKWVQQCNFVFRVAHVVCTHEIDAYMTGDNASGWIIEMILQNDKRVKLYVSCDAATSSVMLRKRMMGASNGLICRVSEHGNF